MTRWEQIVKIYKWFSASCPVFMDAVLISLLGVLLSGLLTFIGWAAISILGWHLLIIAGAILFAVAMVWLAFTHSHYYGGVQEWWEKRPWKT